jgi:hypothetical protein
VHGDPGRREATRGHGFFNPENHVVAGASFVITQVVVQADVGDATVLQELDRLGRPTNLNQAARRRSLVIEVDSHSSPTAADRIIERSMTMATSKDKAKTPSKREPRRGSATSANANADDELRKKTSVQRSKAKYAKAIDALKDK